MSNSWNDPSYLPPAHSTLRLERLNDGIRLSWWNPPHFALRLIYAFALTAFLTAVGIALYFVARLPDGDEFIGIVLPIVVATVFAGLALAVTVVIIGLLWPAREESIRLTSLELIHDPGTQGVLPRGTNLLRMLMPIEQRIRLAEVDGISLMQAAKRWQICIDVGANRFFIGRRLQRPDQEFVLDVLDRWSEGQHQSLLVRRMPEGELVRVEEVDNSADRQGKRWHSQLHIKRYGSEWIENEVPRGCQIATSRNETRVLLSWPCRYDDIDHPRLLATISIALFAVFWIGIGVSVFVAYGFPMLVAAFARPMDGLLLVAFFLPGVLMWAAFGLIPIYAVLQQFKKWKNGTPFICTEEIHLGRDDILFFPMANPAKRDFSDVPAAVQPFVPRAIAIPKESVRHAYIRHNGTRQRLDVSIEDRTVEIGYALTEPEREWLAGRLYAWATEPTRTELKSDED